MATTIAQNGQPCNEFTVQPDADRRSARVERFVDQVRKIPSPLRSEVFAFLAATHAAVGSEANT